MRHTSRRQPVLHDCAGLESLQSAPSALVSSGRERHGEVSRWVRWLAMRDFTWPIVRTSSSEPPTLGAMASCARRSHPTGHSHSWRGNRDIIQVFKFAYMNGLKLLSYEWFKINQCSSVSIYNTSPLYRVGGYAVTRHTEFNSMTKLH